MTDNYTVCLCYDLFLFIVWYIIISIFFSRIGGVVFMLTASPVDHGFEP
jgi:hypothetical protein